MQLTTQELIAVGVILLLICLRRQRTGNPAPVDPEEARAADEAFQLFNDSQP